MYSGSTPTYTYTTMLCEGVCTCNSFQHSDNILFGLYALQTPYLARQVFEVHNYVPPPPPPPPPPPSPPCGLWSPYYSDSPSQPLPTSEKALINAAPNPSFLYTHKLILLLKVISMFKGCISFTFTFKVA